MATSENRKIHKNSICATQLACAKKAFSCWVLASSGAPGMPMTLWAAGWAIMEMILGINVLAVGGRKAGAYKALSTVQGHVDEKSP
jgi:hypothetical protein